MAELRRLKPAPRLVLFAGDLAHNGDPRALALGQEILSGLPAPHLMVMGEGDGLPDGAAAWRRLFGEPWFSYSFSPSPQPSPPSGEREILVNLPQQNPISSLLPKSEPRKPKTLQLIGLHTAWCPGPGGPAFRVGESGRRWLTRELARLDPEAPLIILSHAPLDLIYRPWQQWTVDGPEVLALLTEFRQILCFHGHVHRHGGISENATGLWQEYSFPLAGGGWGEGKLFTPTPTLPPQGGGNKRRSEGQRISFYGLPATAWPGPQALQGTPALPGPRSGSRRLRLGVAGLG